MFSRVWFQMEVWTTLMWNTFTISAVLMFALFEWSMAYDTYQGKLWKIFEHNILFIWTVCWRHYTSVVLPLTTSGSLALR